MDEFTTESKSISATMYTAHYTITTSGAGSGTYNFIDETVNPTHGINDTPYTTGHFPY
jgi:hypothetical protein